MASPSIQFDLQSRFGSSYGPEEEAVLKTILDQGAPTSGAACLDFEQAFAHYCGVKYARVVTNGTAALFLAMIALDIKAGDRVLTTPLTWIATAASAATLGAEVDFVDVDPETYNLDPQKLEEKITPNTKAILPVHLYGQCCDMDPILAIAEKHGIAVVEDACHAPGATYKGKKAGALGDIGCFSFHEQKNLSTLGEGGMVITDNPEYFERISLYRSHCTRVYGESTKYCSIDESKTPMGKRFWWQDFDDVGYNFRMTDIQAAVGMVQLKKLDALNQRRIDIAQTLYEGLKDIEGLTLPKQHVGTQHIFHLFPLQIDAAKFGMDKEDFIHAMLHRFGIKIGIHYIPLHWSTAFRKRGFKAGQFPVADALAQGMVTLPIHPRLSKEGVEYLLQSIHTLQG